MQSVPTGGAALIDAARVLTERAALGARNEGYLAIGKCSSEPFGGQALTPSSVGIGHRSEQLICTQTIFILTFMLGRVQSRIDFVCQRDKPLDEQGSEAD